MTEKFHHQLSDLKIDVLTMGRIAQGMLEDSVTAFIEQDTVLADQVIARTRQLADLDAQIEERSLRLIALNQPVAKDLRILATALKVITYLNRIGRYGKDIARTTTRTADKPHVARLLGIPAMAKMVGTMVADAMAAFEAEDLAPISEMGHRDDDVDELRRSVFRECLTYMMESPANITPCIDYVMVARYLERVGDHSCKISEKVHYMVTGQRLEIN